MQFLLLPSKCLKKWKFLQKWIGNSQIASFNNYLSESLKHSVIEIVSLWKVSLHHHIASNGQWIAFKCKRANQIFFDKRWEVCKM